ncbi:MAG: DNA translocase FtsK, partial [Clostridia bacterium]|nr:DNA translocase FtsK [Clostridia bacterium]
IFDEVMRRTRERVEKSAKKSGVDLQTDDRKAQPVPVETLQTAEGTVRVNISTGEVLQAETLRSVPETLPEEDDVPWYDADTPLDDCMEFPRPAAVGADEKTKTEEPDLFAVSQAETPAESPAESPEETAESFDLSGFFVNPEDAELLDRLSEAYLKKDDKPSSMEVNREIMASGTDERKAESRKAAPVPYNYPPIEILTEDTDDEPVDIKEELQDNAVKLVETLKSFHVNTKIENISRGPTITRYELKPEMGTKVRSISNLVDDIALNLATTGVRIEAPIPGKAAVGIEVPNKRQSTVHLRTLIQSEAFTGAKSRLTCCLGEDVAGEAVYFDIAKMPHLLIAGATGMGKSVCINSLVVSLLYKASPDEVKLILVDPKKVELSIYNGIPHLLVPVVSEPKKAAGSLSWAVGEMERRFGLIEAVGVRDVKNFNEVTKDDPDYEFLPQIVIIIDELADLMMTAPDDVEESICRLAQKARAAGMHLIIGTQRPSVDVITGLIKANIPSRIAFTVASQIDSRTIIDRGGAENLIGRGDMLFNPVGAAKPMRVQGAFVSESDVEEVVSYIKNMNQKCASYSDEVLEQIEMEAAKCGSGKKGSSSSGGAADGDGGEDDPMLRQALELAVESGKISTSLIQRRLQLGYGRAAKLIDRMEQMGYVSPPDGQRPRKVLLTKQEFMELVLNNEME